MMGVWLPLRSQSRARAESILVSEPNLNMGVPTEEFMEQMRKFMEEQATMSAAAAALTELNRDSDVQIRVERASSKKVVTAPLARGNPTTP